MLSEYFSNGKNKTPLPPKPVEDMPHTLAGLSFKAWRDARKKNHKMRNVRWSVLVFMNLLFVVSFAFDLAILEGSLSGSRLVYLPEPDT